MPKKKSKRRVQAEVALWGLFFWMKSLLSKGLPSKPAMYAAYLERLKAQEKEPQQHRIHIGDTRRHGMGEYWFNMILYPVVGAFVLVVGLLVLTALASFVLSFVQGQEDPLTDPTLLVEAPEAVVIEATGVSEMEWWESEIDGWLTSQDSVALREDTNVVNFVLVHVDEVRYAAHQSFRLDDGRWEQRRPFFIDAVSVDGTAVVVEIARQQFNLNAYQPFTWMSSPDTIVMVDSQGRIWVASVSDLDVVETGFELPVVINPNPDLEIGFEKN